MRHLLAVLALLTLLAPPALAETWVQSGRTDDGTAYLDTDSLQIREGGQVEFLQKIVWTPAALEQMAAEHARDPGAAPDSSELSYVLTTYRFDPANRRTLMVWVRGCRSDGSLLGEGPAEGQEWNDTVPGSPMETLVQILEKTLADRK